MSTENRCPECGNEISPNAVGCRCGARKEDGHWFLSDAYDGLDLPGDDGEFDYEQFVAEEFGKKPKRSAKETFWWIVGIVLLIAMLWLSLSGGLF